MKFKLMEKTVPPADVQPNENVAQSSSPHREIELSDAQNAFQEIVSAIDNCCCKNSSCKQDLSKQIKLIADEIVKSKIRDKLLLASRTDLNTKFAQMGINNNKKEKPELLKLKNQVVAQTNSISNQVKYINIFMEKVENLSKENENLNKEVKSLNKKVENLNKEVKSLNKEVEGLRSENVKLQERNDEILAQINEMLQ